MKKDRRIENLINADLEQENPPSHLLQPALFEMEKKQTEKAAKPKVQKKGLALGIAATAFCAVLAVILIFALPVSGFGKDNGGNPPTNNGGQHGGDSGDGDSDDEVTVYYSLSALKKQSITLAEANEIASANGHGEDAFPEVDISEVRVTAFYFKETDDIAFIQISGRRVGESGAIEEVRLFVEFTDKVFDEVKQITQFPTTEFNGETIKSTEVFVSGEYVTYAMVKKTNLKYYIEVMCSVQGAGDYYLNNLLS